MDGRTNEPTNETKRNGTERTYEYDVHCRRTDEHAHERTVDKWNDHGSFDGPTAAG